MAGRVHLRLVELEAVRDRDEGPQEHAGVPAVVPALHVADDEALVEADLVLERQGNEHHRRQDGAGNESEGQNDFSHSISLSG